MTYPADLDLHGVSRGGCRRSSGDKDACVLRGFGQQPIPWVRVYQVPDYVYWAHGTHLAANVTCVECHGPVAERDVIAQETNV